mmetsp:Transcript_22563/g.70013  ORF Transcript_22563/g.70013 Transcript_22563/m.70013 type:complete len:345 (+) Transcript_22563:436-1470(+)
MIPSARRIDPGTPGASSQPTAPPVTRGSATATTRLPASTTRLYLSENPSSHRCSLGREVSASRVCLSTSAREELSLLVLTRTTTYPSCVIPPAGTKSPTTFFTGVASPVRCSRLKELWPSTTVPSTGEVSPARTSTRSPTCTSRTGTGVPWSAGGAPGGPGCTTSAVSGARSRTFRTSPTAVPVRRCSAACAPENMRRSQAPSAGDPRATEANAATVISTWMFTRRPRASLTRSTMAGTPMRVSAAAVQTCAAAAAAAGARAYCARKAATMSPVPHISASTLSRSSDTTTPRPEASTTAPNAFCRPLRSIEPPWDEQHPKLWSCPWLCPWSWPWSWWPWPWPWP